MDDSRYQMGQMRKVAQQVWAWLKGINPFVVAGLLLALWMLWPADYNIWRHLRLQQELETRVAEKKALEQAIKHTEQDLKELENEKELLERYAREQFLMKEDNEELYLIEK